MFRIGDFFRNHRKSQTREEVNYFDSNPGVPDELILNILKFLDIFALYKMSLTCKRFKGLSEDAQLWKCLCIRDFFNVNIKDENQNYKKIYYENSFKFLNFQPPGEGASFKLIDKKNWKPISFKHCDSEDLIFSRPGDNFQKVYGFVSENNQSLLIKFTLIGAENGGLALSLIFKEFCFKQLFLKYIREILSVSEYAQITFFEKSIATDHPKLIKKFFKIFISFNSLPNEHEPFIKKIIQSENWKHIPLPPHKRAQSSNTFQ